MIGATIRQGRAILPLVLATLVTTAAWPETSATPALHGETPARRAQASSVAIVESWFDAMNGLDDSQESVDRLVSIYSDEAQHITWPESHQRGTVTFDGADALRHMALRLVERYDRLILRIEAVTANEQTERLFHVTDGPWGGESVAVQFWLSRTDRDSGKRTTFPAAGFFRIVNGHIAQARIYRAHGESAEVERLR